MAWPEVLMYTTYVQNRTPMARLVNETAYDMVYETSFKVSEQFGGQCFLRIFQLHFVRTINFSSNRPGESATLWPNGKLDEQCIAASEWHEGLKKRRQIEG